MYAFKQYLKYGDNLHKSLCNGILDNRYATEYMLKAVFGSWIVVKRPQTANYFEGNTTRKSCILKLT